MKIPGSAMFWMLFAAGCLYMAVGTLWVMFVYGMIRVAERYTGDLSKAFVVCGVVLGAVALAARVIRDRNHK